MSGELRIRPIEEEDAPALHELLNQVDAETDFMLFEPGERQSTIEQHRQRIRDILSRPNQTLLVAEVSGQLAGYLIAMGGELERVRHRAYIVVGILQAFVGQGIGTRLFEALEAWAGTAGIERLELTVRTDNTRATSLYEKAGFSTEGVRQRSLIVRGAYHDEYHMAKILMKSDMSNREDR